MTQIPNDMYEPQARHQYGSDTSILMITTDGVEDLEFFYPYYRFIEEGYKVDVVTPDGGEFEGKMGMRLKETKKLHEVTPEKYDLLYIPGGKAPAQLKKDKSAIELTQRFAATGKPIASICHGPQLLAEADVIEGYTIAAWPEVQEELEKAGAKFVNQETCVDRQFITARWPGDLPAHLAKTLEILKQSKAQISGTMTPRFAA